ncbi:MAG TPA: secretin N-terminal domain-containing protein [Gemmatimonadaceae bacterium]|nr:secretin N-terminal domain-containing protein [Gemmatimonadaceae bacterium]
MNETIRPMRGVRELVAVAAALSAVACASAPVARPGPYQVGTSVAAPPSLPPASSGPVAARQAGEALTVPPTMAPAEPSIVGMPSARVNIAANNEEVSTVIQRMARQVGLSAIIDPAVRGPVTRTLQNVSLNDAMASLVGNQFQYQVRNGALVVSPVQLMQHTYTVDYLTMSRIATASTVVSRGTQGASATSNTGLVAGTTGTGTGVSSTAGGLVASGADVIQSSSQVDVWGELTQQLESIVFSGRGDSASRGSAPGTAGAIGGARPYQRCDPDSGFCLRISPLTSLVDVTATPQKHDEVARYIGLFSAAIQRQVLIKAQVVEVGLDRSHSFGIDWQAVLSTAKASIAVASNPLAAFAVDPGSTVTGSGNVSLNLGLGDFTLKAVLNTLETIGDVTVVANPTTNALNQQKASFNVTRQEQFFTITRTPITSPTTGAITGYSETPAIQTATVGLVFDVLPQISDKNIVTMAIRPSVTSIVGRTVIESSSGIQATLPVTDHRETDTMARVRSGETIMIGGLIQKQVSTVRSGIPVLMHLPLVGRIFSSTKVIERNSELVIFLTPEIVSGQPPGGP